MIASSDSLRALRSAARQRLAQLDAQIVALRAERGMESADDEHDPEGSPLSGEWSRLAGLRRAAQADLTEIDDALVRVEDGTYGTCLRCGRAIAPARLDARPAATHCIDCASSLSR